jgi:DNA-binding transcriptional MerR regulator
MARYYDRLTAADVCAHAGITHRNLDYWLRSGVIDLPDRRDIGSGNFRFFTDSEADAIRRVAAEKRELDQRFSDWSSGVYWHSLTEQRVA